MKTIFCFLLSAMLLMTATGQTPAPCEHDPNKLAFWEGLRMMPVRILEVKDNTVFWQYQDRQQLKLGSFELYEQPILTNREGVVERKYLETRHDGEWLVIYCERCKTVFRLHHSPPQGSVPAEPQARHKTRATL